MNSRRKSVFQLGALVWISLSVLFFAFPALAQSGQPSAPPEAQSAPPAAPETAPSASQQPFNSPSNGSIGGTIADETGTAIPGARVILTREDGSPPQEVHTGNDGQFSFTSVAPGPFTLTITAEAFSSQTVSGTLHADEIYMVPQIITLKLAPVVTMVRVTPLTEHQQAEIQVKQEEKQRVLGLVPNYFVTYEPNAVPLDTKQKFELASKVVIDPVSLTLLGALAGLQQANNSFSGYGQGAQGYGKRYGADYGDVFIGTYIGSALLPSLLKQDPRYFYKGKESGSSTGSRILYALEGAFVCKGDNGRWQPNYSNVLGEIATGGISNLYYPPQNRGVGLTFETAAIRLGETMGSNILQEFIIPKLTPRLSRRERAQP